ncbi:MAG: SprB repeat-containing protein, partial [Saprospiraceae bacterium]|nr:SprB repeat-containing protein [Saprospiraceae bacterium]
MKTILPALALCLASTCLSAQYLETFSTPNKGYLLNQNDDFTGVNWTLSAWANQPPALFGRDSSDYFQTTATGQLECIDLDQAVCWESPLLNTSAAGLVTLSVELSWEGFDTDQLGNPCNDAGLDYINVQYSVNGGAFVSVPNQVGGSACATIGYVVGTPNAPFTGSTTVTVTGITGGSNLRIRICVNTNANAEVVRIDNVAVPTPGVTTGCSAPVLSTEVIPVGCLGPNSGAVILTANGGTPGYSYAWSNGANTPDLAGVPVGTYTVTVTDGGNCTATASATVPAAPTLSAVADVGPLSCTPANDGAIDLILSGGTAPFLINWSDLPGLNDGEDRQGLAAGTYTATITDALACTTVVSATVGLAPSGAYLETFSVAGKGLLEGSTCTGMQ